MHPTVNADHFAHTLERERNHHVAEGQRPRALRDNAILNSRWQVIDGELRLRWNWISPRPFAAQAARDETAA